MSLRVTDPIAAGSLRGIYNASSINNTDWNDLSSDDFQDSTTGSALAAGLKFTSLVIVNKGSGVAYVKYRARTGAGDAVTNEIPIDYSFSDDVGTLNTSVSTIAYKKDAGASSFWIYAGFDK